MFQSTRIAGYGTEYTDNYDWGKDHAETVTWNKDTGGVYGQPEHRPQASQYTGHQAPQGYETQVHTSLQQTESPYMPPTRVNDQEFYSEKYPSIYRETVIHKDDRGKYIDPFKNIANKPYGRRLMYDDTHPDKMYPSQWSSELADANGVYSFPTTTGLAPEQPWTKDMSWRVESQQGDWPTNMWKEWTQAAECPPYNGHSDQPQYSLYKVDCPPSHP